jgi:hypothetical protein
MRYVTTVKMAILGGNDYRGPKYKDIYRTGTDIRVLPLTNDAAEARQFPTFSIGPMLLPTAVLNLSSLPLL